MQCSIMPVSYTHLDVYKRQAKRCVDLAGSFFGLILISPVLLFVAFLVKATSKGPVIFKQERVGPVSYTHLDRAGNAAQRNHKTGGTGAVNSNSALNWIKYKE